MSHLHHDGPGYVQLDTAWLAWFGFHFLIMSYWPVFSCWVVVLCPDVCSVLYFQDKNKERTDDQTEEQDNNGNRVRRFLNARMKSLGLHSDKGVWTMACERRVC